MSLLTDPALCPDCRGSVLPDASCSACGLRLVGPLAVDLWRTMQHADDLVGRLRAAQAAAAPRPAAAALPTHPASSASAERSERRRLPLGAVPLVLLGLGALCVLVAAGLFLAVAWTVLPLGAKAVLALAVTLALGAVAIDLCRRGLRSAGEAFWALVAGVLALDVAAAHRSGLLGLDRAPGWAVTVGCGVLLVVLGTSVGRWVRTTPAARCVSAEATLVLGALLVAAAGCWDGPYAGGAGPALGTVLLVAVGALLLPHLPEAARGVLGLGVLTWAALALAGLDAGSRADDRSAYWAGLGAWQLPLAAAYAVGVALLPWPHASALRTEQVVRTGSATAGLGCLVGFVLLPGGTDAVQALLTAAVTVVLAGVAATAPTLWARAAAVVGGLLAAAAVAACVVVPLVEVLDLLDRAPAWSGPADLTVTAGGDPGWTLPVLLAAAYAVVVGAVRLLPWPRTQVARLALAALPALLALAVAAALVSLAAPLWSVVVVLSLGGASLVRPGHGLPARVALLGALPVLLALLAGSRSDVVSAVLGTVLAVAATAVLLGTSRARGAAAAVVAVLLSGQAVLAWTLAAGGGPGVRATLLVGSAALWLLAAAYVARDAAPRVAAEAACVVPAVVALVVASPDRHLVALVLSVAGSGIALLSVLHRDRLEAGWLASGVLAAATFTRVGDGAPGAPELYALPAAVVLLFVGAHRLRAEPDRSSWRLLGAGLGLAIAPSLVLALPDPGSVRALLVGSVALAALAVGVRRRWQAPFVTGAGALLVLAVRFLGPLGADLVATPFGPWLAFGVIGAALLSAGIAWDRALTRLRTASVYLTGLT